MSLLTKLTFFGLSASLRHLMHITVGYSDAGDIVSADKSKVPNALSCDHIVRGDTGMS